MAAKCEIVGVEITKAREGRGFHGGKIDGEKNSVNVTTAECRAQP
jgi:hypothetical protein